MMPSQDQTWIHDDEPPNKKAREEVFNNDMDVDDGGGLRINLFSMIQEDNMDVEDDDGMRVATSAITRLS
jgi:hypothetical protein